MKVLICTSLDNPKSSHLPLGEVSEPADGWDSGLPPPPQAPCMGVLPLLISVVYWSLTFLLTPGVYMQENQKLNHQPEKGVSLMCGVRFPVQGRGPCRGPAWEGVCASREWDTCGRRGGCTRSGRNIKSGSSSRSSVKLLGDLRGGM